MKKRLVSFSKRQSVEHSAVPLFLPRHRSRPLKLCPVTGAAGGAYCGSALCSEVIFSACPCRLAPPGGSLKGWGQILVLFHAYCAITALSYPLFPLLSRENAPIFAENRGIPAAFLTHIRTFPARRPPPRTGPAGCRRGTPPLGGTRRRSPRRRPPAGNWV